MEQSFPFDAVMTDGVPDRSYSAEDLAAVFSGIFAGGVLSEADLKVRPCTDGTLGVQLSPGAALIQGYFYRNTEARVLTLETAPLGLNRIDLVVLHLDKENRTIYPTVLTGGAALSPSVPSFTQSGSVYEIPLGQISVSSGATRIDSTDIMDRRPLNRLRAG